LHKYSADSLAGCTMTRATVTDYPSRVGFGSSEPLRLFARGAVLAGAPIAGVTP